MTVQPRPQPLHPPVDSFLSLQAWIDRRLRSIESDLGDDETMQALGRDGAVKLQERRATLQDVAHAIFDALTAEETDLAAMLATDDARWREAYGPDAPNLAAWQAEGR